MTKDKEPKSRKKPTNIVIQKVKREKAQRNILICIPKGQFPPEKLLSCIGVAVQTALNELGVKVSITIREGELDYEVIAEE